MEHELSEHNSLQEPGETLRRAREAAGLTKKEIADSLNLMLSNIEAIEANQYEKMNAGLFVRGYVKSYARFLGLDVDALVAAADLRLKGAPKRNGKHTEIKQDTAIGTLSAVKPAHKVLAAIFAAALIWLGVGLMLSGSPEIESPEPGPLPSSSEAETETEAEMEVEVEVEVEAEGEE